MRNNKRAMQNNEAGNNETAKQRKGDTKLRDYETTKGRNCERAMRKSEILKRFYIETAKQRKGKMALSGHHRDQLTVIKL